MTSGINFRSARVVSDWTIIVGNFSGMSITRLKTVQLVQLVTEALESFNNCMINVVHFSEIK